LFWVSVTTIGIARDNTEEPKAIAEPHLETIQGIELRPKRATVKPPYLRDFVEK